MGEDDDSSLILQNIQNQFKLDIDDSKTLQGEAT